MKKTNLFKMVFITLAAVLVLSWIIPAATYNGSELASGSISRIPLIALFDSVVTSASAFTNIAIFLLSVGAFYGVLNAIDSYSALIQKIAKKLKGKELETIIATISLFAILASLVQLPFVLFAFVPFFVSVLLVMGIDKLSALASTIGAVAIGIFGTTVGYSIAGNINDILGLETSIAILYKTTLLVLGIALLIYFVMVNKKKVTAKARTEKDYYPLYIPIKKKKENDVTPIIVILAITGLFFILGYISWSQSFGIEWFNDLHAKIMGAELFGFKIIESIFHQMPAFGLWTYAEAALLLLLMSLVLAFVYRIKTNEYIIAATEGIKKMLPSAGLAIFAMATLVLYNSTIAGDGANILNAFYNFFLGFGDVLKFIFMPILVVISAILSVDPYYVVGAGVTFIKSSLTDLTLYPTVAVLFQSVYGIATLFVPTSIIMLVGLSYLDIDYKSWIKYIYKLLLMLFALAIVVTLLVFFF